MANSGAILCCSSVVPIDDANRQDEEVDHMAFIDFANKSGTAADFASLSGISTTTPRENNQLLSIPKDEDLDHFFICRHLVQPEPNDVTGAYRYVEAEFADREKLGESRVSSERECKCVQHNGRFEMTILRKAS
ncbi:hypothetical protein LTR56_010678 [Elasticomyces elasticus]|nr:hypothetical protein LTR56_010678 [Elasticomyces elasticus]KAK3655389.1 hypothetical protein LTR22_010274 [Elasticomyces elasticus]KAK4922123.1 hypothetical protein LTR49_010534 [Elasticomyces elasticus]KAK5751556.1 hypothetical protein LTS12_018398 [Elasticomyces elasticus]